MRSLLSNIRMSCKMLSSSINYIFLRQITNSCAQFRRAVDRPSRVSSLNRKTYLKEDHMKIFEYFKRISAAEDSDEARLNKLSQAISNVGIHLYKKLASEKGNVFISPPSLSSALTMAFCGARGETALELRQVLGYNAAGLKNDEDVRRCFYHLLTCLSNNNSKAYTFICNNVILGQHKLPFKEDFKTNLAKYFSAMVQNVDFRDSEKAVRQVNDWVNEKTNGMIPKFIEKLTPNTLLIILNAVYFKGFWEHEFPENATTQRNFYNEGSERSVKKVDMMYVKEYFRFTQNESFSAIQLPYVGEDISMLILLPNVRNGLEAVENELPSDFLEELKEELKPGKVKLGLPKFRLEYSTSLKEQFQSIGLNLVFSEDACFDGMSELAGFFIGDVIHKAVVNVDEKGSEAAAATALIMRGAGRPSPVDHEFIADHPFMFLIYNEKTDLILFLGRINKL